MLNQKFLSCFYRFVYMLNGFIYSFMLIGVLVFIMRWITKYLPNIIIVPAPNTFAIA